MRTRPETGWAAAFFVAVSLWLTWPVAARLGSGLSGSPDALLNFWALSWSYHVLPRAPLAFFDANIFFPRQETLAYSEHLFGVTLFAAPAYLLTGSALTAYNFAILGSFAVAGLGMFLLVRALTGSAWAGSFAGLAYLAAPFRFLHLLHVQILAMQWFPFVFLFLYRFLRSGRKGDLAACGGFALLQILSCNYYAFYLALALALFAGIAIVAGRGVLTARRAAWLAGAAGVASLLALPFALPYLRNAERGFYRRYEDVVQFSARPVDYLRPTALNKAHYARFLPPQVRSEKALFPGFALMLLAAVGAWAGRRRTESDHTLRIFWLFFLLLLPAAFLLSLGPEIEIGGSRFGLPYRPLYRHLPGFGGMRAPARLAVLVLLSLCALAGWGLSAILDRFPRRRAAIGFGALALALLEVRTHPLDRVFPRAPETPPVYHWLARQPGDFGILELPLHEDITREAIRMYHSTVHWKRLANGFSGWWPNDYWVLVGRMRHFPTANLLRFLERDVPVRMIVIHYEELAPDRRRKLERDMARYRDRMPLRARFGADAVHEILPAPAPASAP